MQNHARAVVIGGGCVGAGILYGLTRRGWTDVVLLERTQLTAGSTWHAAGLIPSYARDRSIGIMIQKSIEIYEGLEAETGMPVGWHKCGQLRLAKSAERLNEYHSYMDVHHNQGIRAEMLDARRVKELWPLLRDDEEMLGALYHPDDGHIAPADVTMAMARGARDRGAKIHQNTEVRSVSRTATGEWKVVTSQGEILCEHVICATGNYTRQTGAMFGLEIPAIPIIHQYWITEAVNEIRQRKEAGLPEMPILRDERFEGYLREEGDGLMFGPYERTEHLQLFAEDGVPEWFGADLMEEDFDSVATNWETAIESVPLLGRVGIKANVRGPFQMTPDELPLMGKAWNVPNLWLAEGVPGGILWGGALGYYLSQQIVEGGNEIDTSVLEPRRFGDHANKNWTRPKVREAWGTHAEQHFPGEDRPAARPAKTAPSYDFLDRRGAVWGVLNGWEHPNWFAPEGVEQKNQYSWRWTEKGRYVGQEVRAVREAAGMVEMTFMAKFDVSGPGAAAWLDGILANRLPKVGRANLTHMLTDRGTVLAEYVLARLEEDRFFLVGTPSAERYYFDELARRLPSDGSVALRNVSNERAGLAVVGPKAREILAPLTGQGLENADFPWFGVRNVNLGLASDVRMLRVNYEGELGWEIYCPIQYQRGLIELIHAEGQKHGMRLVGTQALESLRLEKSYRSMFRDMNGELTAWESSLDRFIAMDKGDFTGRAALEGAKAAGVAQRTVTVSIPAEDGSVWGGESLFHEGRLVGRLTSGGHSYTFGHDIGIALVPVELVKVGQSFDLTVLGAPRKATLIDESPYDPTSARARV
ncbi:GcvT family protein [Paracoccus sp. MC1854]|uniref:GcvT family protein n=1 Tax=Paracoccus sp. MC1854 TaxID=2760306 RepID=UPI00160081CF|nr:FAD-dependent oxidoreductase [Paracoccus sp. MC1854]MBB1492910.1 GcvT family protein [Paracoccus sp. MC1854]